MEHDELKALWDSKVPQEGNLLDTFWNEPNTVQAAVNLAHNLNKSVNHLMTGDNLEKLIKGDTMQFDYQRETFEIDNHVFVIREVTSGAYEELQRKFFGDVSLSTKKEHLERQMNEKRVNFAEFAQHKNLLAVESWTYKGENVPLEIANWRAAPKRITDAAEKVIERLNPEDSAEFPEGHGNGSES